MTESKIHMETLWRSLKGLGFDKEFVRQIALPDWWVPEFEARPEAVVSAATYVSRRLNIDVFSLIEPEATPAFKPSNAKFKTQPGTEIQQMLLAQSMAARIAQMVAYACRQEYKPLPTSPDEVRQEILFRHEFIALEGLLEFCWSYGVPVVYADRFPQGVERFQGMAAYFYDRPTIVISNSQVGPAFLLLLVAHELGHVIRGHVLSEAIVDEDLKLEKRDREEIEANEFAMELLLGKQEGGDLEITIPELLDRITAGKHHVKISECDVESRQIINSYVLKYLDIERLDIDSQEYLKLALGGRDCQGFAL